MGKKNNEERAQEIRKIEELTGRNVFVYYSDLNSERNEKKLGIRKGDEKAMRVCLAGLDKSKGIDLILHTPGGEILETHKIIELLRTYTDNDLRVIVPQIAMSGGTIISLAAKEIIMSEQASLGPIDPQLYGIPLIQMLYELDYIIDSLENRKDDPFYLRVVAKKYIPFMMSFLHGLEAYYNFCFSWITDKLWIRQIRKLRTEFSSTLEVSKDMTKKWLGSGMFDANDPEDQKKIDYIINKLNDRDYCTSHAKQLNIDRCRNDIGLNITRLEDNEELANHVLHLHDMYIQMFIDRKESKILETKKLGILDNRIRQVIKHK